MAGPHLMFALLKPSKQPRETFVPTLNKQEGMGGKKATSASVHMHFKAEADFRAPTGVRGEERRGEDRKTVGHAKGEGTQPHNFRVMGARRLFAQPHCGFLPFRTPPRVERWRAPQGLR